MSFKDKSFELALAKTCKTLYERYELYYEKQTAVVLYDPRDKFSYYSNSIKALQLYEPKWLGTFEIHPNIGFSE